MTTADTVPWFARMAEVAHRQMAELYPDMAGHDRTDFLYALAETLQCGPQAVIMFLSQNPEALRKILLDNTVRSRAAGLLVIHGEPEPVYCLINDAQVGLALIGPRDRWLGFKEFTTALAHREF